MLEEDALKFIPKDLADMPEPEQPEAFCKRYGVKINYNYLRNDIGPRVDRYC